MTFYEAMNEVLLSSRYNHLTGRGFNIRERLSELFWNFIDWIFDSIFSRLNFSMPSGGGYNISAISTTFAVVGIILVIVAGVIIFRTLRRARMEEDYDFSDIFEELTKKNYTVSELIKLSEGANDRRFAVRYRYIAALLDMNQRAIIEIKPSATNAIILHQIKYEAPTLVPYFQRTADVFHRAWFGYKDISDATFGHFTNAVDKIITAGDDNAQDI